MNDLPPERCNCPLCNERRSGDKLDFRVLRKEVTLSIEPSSVGNSRVVQSIAAALADDGCACNQYSRTGLHCSNAAIHCDLATMPTHAHGHTADPTVA